MKPEVRFGIVLGILFVLLFLFAKFLAPSIKSGIETAVLGDGYELHESDKFRIHYPVNVYSEQTIQKLNKDLISFTDEFRSKMKKNSVDISDFELCTVYLLRSHHKLQDFGMQMEVADMSNNGGYFSPSTTSIAVIGADIEVLRHELVHMLFQMSKSLTGNKLQPWLDEAFAQFFEKYPAKQSLNAVKSMLKIEEIVHFKREDFSKPDNPGYYKSSLYLLTFLLEQTKTSNIVYKNLRSSLTFSSQKLLSDLEALDLEKLNTQFKNWYMNIK